MPRKIKHAQSIDAKAGRALHSLRITSGLSRSQLSKKVGVTHQQIQKYEKGTNRMSVGRFVSFCEVFNVSFSDVIEMSKIEMDANKRLSIEIQRCLAHLSPKAKKAIHDIARTMVEEKK